MLTGKDIQAKETRILVFVRLKHRACLSWLDWDCGRRRIFIKGWRRGAGFDIDIENTNHW